MQPEDTPLSREALLNVFCKEAKGRLVRVLDCLRQGPDACDYEAVHQEFDSLHGGARAVDLPWLEHFSQVAAGYARFLRHLRRGGHHAETHALLTRAVEALSEQCLRLSPEALAPGTASLLPMQDLLGAMQGAMQEADPAELSPCVHRPASRPLKLLVVDDSSTSRLLFRIHLPQEGGHEVREAEDAETALAAALEMRPDVVFLDYNMPDCDGVAIALRLRAAGLDPCFVLLTANVQQSVLEQARAAGFAGVLEKPVNRDKIAVVLNAVLRE